MPRLDAFPDERSWSIRLRRPLLEISQADAALLRTLLSDVAGEPAQNIGAYLERIRSVLTS